VCVHVFVRVCVCVCVCAAGVMSLLCGVQPAYAAQTMCVCMYVCLSVYLCVCVCVCMCVYVCACVCACVCAQHAHAARLPNSPRKTGLFCVRDTYM